MVFFRNYFEDTDFDQANSSGEVAVRCPFPHFSGKVKYTKRTLQHTLTKTKASSIVKSVAHTIPSLLL